jgi:hypothetical protein
MDDLDRDERDDIDEDDDGIGNFKQANDKNYLTVEEHEQRQIELEE